MDFQQVLADVLKRLKVKQDVNVVELYFGKHQLESVNSLERFRLLQRVWLNSNKLRSLICPKSGQSFLKNNYRITELYFQNNDLCSIRGTISHLPYLQILMLQKNQLDNMQDVISELKTLQSLRVLNLFDNPLTQEHGYRHLIIHSLPSVELLDRQGVTHKERRRARNIHERLQEEIRATVAFGRRTSIDAALLHTLATPPKPYFAPKFNRDKSLELSQRSSRSVMQYTTFDWSRMPTCQQKRLGEAVPPPQNLTVKLR